MSGQEGTMTGTDPLHEPGRRLFSRLALVALVLAVVGAAIGVWGFVSGIDYALNGSGRGPGPSIIVFFVGAAIVVASVVLAIVALVRSSTKTVPTIALAVGLLPIAGLLVVVLANRR
jgi:hypothetical protein